MINASVLDYFITDEGVPMTREAVECMKRLNWFTTQENANNSCWHQHVTFDGLEP
uniref:Uncharacterized protein n=1 Tax=Physcomitrium patens TaxID=3218 RepID=A0A7I4FGM8_PHYPA